MSDRSPQNRPTTSKDRGRSRCSKSREASARLIGERVRIDFVPERAGDFPGREVCADKAREELGWAATVDFDDGLRDTVGWFCAKWGHPLGNGDGRLPAGNGTARGPGRPPTPPRRARQAPGQWRREGRRRLVPVLAGALRESSRMKIGS